MADNLSMGGGASGGNASVEGDRSGGRDGREKVAPQVSLMSFVR